jgi:hypothetical protein
MEWFGLFLLIGVFCASLETANLLASSSAGTLSRRSIAANLGWVVTGVLLKLNPMPGPPTSVTESMLESVTSSTTSKLLPKLLAAASGLV